MTPGVCNCGSASFTFSRWFVGLFYFLPFVFFLLLIPASSSRCPESLSSSLHFISYHFISPPPLLPSLNLSSSVRVRLTIISRKARAHFGQNQLTQKSLYNPRSYEPCKCRLKNDVCGAALLLGFPKYSGQIVFARHCERHYPSF